MCGTQLVTQADMRVELFRAGVHDDVAELGAGGARHSRIPARRMSVTAFDYADGAAPGSRYAAAGVGTG